MRSVRLSDREMGSEFCKFERKLIFDPEFENFGYVHYTSSRHFILKKSFFTDIQTSRLYEIQDGMSRKPDEGAFIEVDPMSSRMELNFRRMKRSVTPDPRSRVIVEVGSFKDARVPRPPPDLPLDEFLHRISANWKNAEDDMLDKVIGLTLVSAPFSVYGRGGLGSEGLPSRDNPNTGTPRDVSDTILVNLPVEFRTAGSSIYRYRSLDTLRSFFGLRSTDVKEDCYTVLRPRSMKDSLWKPRKERERGSGPPVQLPFTLFDAVHTGKKVDFDIDVLEYQLSALYLPPPEEDAVEKFARDIVKDAHQDAFFDMPGLGEPDPLAPVKLGLAVSRLHIGKAFDGKGYTRSLTDPSKGRELLEDLLKRGLETVRGRILEENMLSREKGHPWAKKLKPLDRRIYFQLRTLLEENGISEVPIESVSPDTDRRSVQESLERLNRYGYVLLMKGGTMIKVVVGSGVDDQ